MLLAHGADANARNNDGHTPLQAASAGDHKDVVEILLAHKADVNAMNNNGSTALKVVAVMGREDMV